MVGVQIDCPYCGSRLAVPRSSHEIQETLRERPRLRGDDHVCRECENELGIYYY